MGELKSRLDISLKKVGKMEKESGEKIVSLSNKQREKIAEIRSLYDAKIAEREIMHQGNKEKTMIRYPSDASSQIEELNKIFNEEKAVLLKERDNKIEAIRRKKS